MTAASDDKYDPSRFKITVSGMPLNPAHQANMVETVLRPISIECCGCGEDDHNKLTSIIVTIPHKKKPLKPKTFLCRACIKELEFNKPR